MAEYIERKTTCKDCIHYDVCYHIEHHGRELETKEPCKQFKFADVVEVVRCSECQHRHNPMRCALWYGTLGDNEYFLEHGDKFYCAFGERRLENES